MPSKVLATVASEKSNSKFFLEMLAENQQNPQARMVLPLAPIKCGPEGGSVEACGKMDSDAPESRKNKNCSMYHQKNKSFLLLKRHCYC
jgi:hypothetical protein